MLKAVITDRDCGIPTALTLSSLAIVSCSREAFHDVNKNKECVTSATGYLEVTLSIVKVTSTISVRAGINFLIKHVRVIFSNLFQM
ncbi:hypothetical protein ACHAWF_016080 [Thalassiosira exigua]